MNLHGRILLVGSGSPVYRRYIMESMLELGVQVVLLKVGEASWEKAYISDLIQVGSYEVTAALQALGRRGRSALDGVLTYSEDLVPLTALIAQALDLRGITPDAAVRCRDKLKMRQALAAAGVPVPRCALVPGEADPIPIAEEVGYPLVVKPVDGAGSVGVIRVDGPDRLREVVRSTRGVEVFGRKPSGVLVEEYLNGTEVSVETVASEGRVVHLGITDKHTSPEPFFEEVGHTVPSYRYSPSVERSILDIAGAALAALGVTVGVAHTEVRLTSSGPRVVEVAARLGGDLIPHLWKLATGADLASTAARAALGEALYVRRRYERGAAVVFFVPEGPGIVQHVEGTEIAGRMEGVVEISIREGLVGTRVGVPPESFLTRLGYVIATAGTPEQAEIRARSAAAAVRVSLGGWGDQECR